MYGQIWHIKSTFEFEMNIAILFNLEFTTHTKNIKQTSILVLSSVDYLLNF